jgi:ABC-type sugar transport system substrate-binding protein
LSPSTEPSRGTVVARVALASALLGAAMSALTPSYHVAIEPAQVLAGLVPYPPDNPFYLYQRRLWTI